MTFDIDLNTHKINQIVMALALHTFHINTNKSEITIRIATCGQINIKTVRSTHPTN